jgi:WD40 repeat protein
LTILSMIVMELLYNLLDIPISSDIEDLMVIWFFCWPVIGIGALGGFAGSALARKRSKRISPWKAAIVGGLVGSLLIALLMTSRIYVGGVASAKEHQKQEKTQQALEMRPDSEKPIPLLAGNFRELTTITNFESMAVSSDGRKLAIAANRQITLWDIENNTKLGQELIGHTSTINDLAFSSDGRRLVSGSADQKVIEWSIPDGKQIFVLEEHLTVITSVAVNSDGTLAASGDGDGIIILWDLINGREIARLENDNIFINSLDFSPDGKLLAACTNEVIGPKAITLWDVAQHEVAGNLELPNLLRSVYALSFSPNGKLIVGAVQGGPVVWDVETRKPLGATQRIGTDRGIDFSPDSRWFVFSNNSTIYIFDAVTREPVGRLPDKSADSSEAIFLPNGQLLTLYWQLNVPSQIGIWKLETP